MTRQRILRWIEIVLLFAGVATVIWLSLRIPDRRAGLLTAVRGVVCTPSIERLRSQARLRGCGPEPGPPGARPPEFKLMPLHLPPQPNPVAGAGETCLS